MRKCLQAAIEAIDREWAEPMKLEEPAEAVAEMRSAVAFLENDRQVAPDIEAVAACIGAGAFDRIAGVSVEGG